MDMLILGLLMLKNVTAYEIRSFLREGMYLMYSDSMGSIQAALKKLLKEQYITFEEHVEYGKNKKVYTITDLGKASFLQWLAQPPKPGTAQSRELCRLFFMGLLPAEKRIPLLSDYIAVLREKQQTMHAIQEKAGNASFDEGLKEIAAFQQATIRLSADSIQFEIDWYQSLIHKIEAGEDGYGY